GVNDACDVPLNVPNEQVDLRESEPDGGGHDSAALARPPCIGHAGFDTRDPSPNGSLRGARGAPDALGLANHTRSRRAPGLRRPGFGARARIQAFPAPGPPAVQQLTRGRAEL